MGDLSSTEIAALAAAGVVLIAAFFAGISQAITAWRGVSGKITAIDAHVNSEKTADKGEIATLRAENVLLRETIADKKQTDALLAQAATKDKA